MALTCSIGQGFVCPALGCPCPLFSGEYLNGAVPKKLFIEIGSHLTYFVSLLIENVATFAEIIPALVWLHHTPSRWDEYVKSEPRSVRGM